MRTTKTLLSASDHITLDTPTGHSASFPKQKGVKRSDEKQREANRSEEKQREAKRSKEK